MHLAYVDESVGPSTFTLGCALVPDTQWANVLDDLVGFRQFLYRTFRLTVRSEIKANFLLYNKGPFRPLGLSASARFAIYRGFMRLQAKIALQVFAVVIRKIEMERQGIQHDPREVAWEYLIQRLERFTTKGNTQVILFHDEGEGDLVRRFVRRARRIGTAGSAFGTGSLKRPARGILDDPVIRKSHESYFIQLADLDAYAAFRRIFPPPGQSKYVVPTAMWDELGTARYTAVNQLVGGTPGIVVWP